jgi:small subunit ribosomal protein S1
MVKRNLLTQDDLSEEIIERELDALFPGGPDGWLPPDRQDFRASRVVIGRVLRITRDEVWLDVGYKSDGAVQLREWFDDDAGQVVPPHTGDDIPVLLEAAEDESGALVLSYRKARRQAEWEAFIARHREGDVVSGPVVRQVKGGLLVNVGVSAFLPASQVDVRRPPDIAEFVGKTVECRIVAIDQARRNIVVNRRQLLEERRAELREKLLAEVREGQVRSGTVRSIVSFGAFVDLGGLDALLHISDMAWERVTDPCDKVHIGQQLEAHVLRVDRAKGKVALSLKHKTPSPWARVADKYPVGSRHTGQVVNVMSYGAFVKLEPGLEGLVHVSEMSWTRTKSPNELVAAGDKIEVQVLNINKDKQEISLGMKQVQPNPWDKAAEQYPPGTVVEGVVRNLTNYGAFIEIEEGIDGLLHVGDMSWLHKRAHAGQLVSKGDRVRCVVLNVDRDRKRIALGLKQMANDPWEDDIPGRYHPGQTVKGKVTKLTNFGVFVELEPGLEGLLHISELADHKVDSPEGAVKVGDEVEVKVLRVDTADRKIGLSRKRLNDADGAAATTAHRKVALRGGTGLG